MTESYFVRKRKLGKTGSVLNEEKETHNEKDVNPSVWKPKPPAPGGGFIVEKDDFEKKLRVEYQKTPVASGRLGRYYEDPPLLPDGTTPGKRRDYAKKWIQEIYERILVLHSNPIVATLRISTLYSLADPNSFISSPDSGIFKTITSIGAKINKLSSVNWDEFEEVEAETAAAEAGSDDEEKDAWDEVQFVYGNSAQSDIEKDELKNIMDQKDKISTDAYYRKLSDFFKEKSRNLEAKIQANNKANAGKKAGGSQHTSTAFTKWKALKLLLTSSRPSDQTLAMMQALFKEDEVDLEWISYPGIGGFLVLDDMTYASVTTAKAVIDLRWERVSEKDSKDAPTYTELFTKHQTPFGWIIGMQIRLSKANRFSMGEKEQAQKEMRIEEWACQIIDTHLNRPKRPIEELYCSNFSEEGRHYRCWKNTKWAN